VGGLGAASKLSLVLVLLLVLVLVLWMAEGATLLFAAAVAHLGSYPACLVSERRCSIAVLLACVA